MIGLIISFESLKVCVYDKRTNEPLEAVELYTPLTFTFTDHNGCAFIKIRENDSLIIYRVGYKTLTLKGKIEDKIYLESEGISLKTVEVISKSVRINEIKDKRNELENTSFGIAINKPIISGFNRDKYNIIIDGAFLNDQSDYLDHPIVVDFDLVDKLSILNVQNNAILGLNSIAGGIDLKLFDISNNNFSVFLDYLSLNNRFSIGLKNSRIYNNFGYKFGIKGSISSDYLNPKIENTSDSSLYTIFSIKYNDFKIGNYLSFINYGVPNSDSRASNIFTNPRITYKNLIFDVQYSSQKEFGHEHINILHTEPSTILELLTFQAIYNANNLYLNLTSNNFKGKGEENINYNRTLLTILYSKSFKSLFNYAISLIPNYSNFDNRFKLGFTFLLEKSINDFSLSFSQSTQQPSLQQLTFTGIHESANRYEIVNKNLKDEYSFNFSINYKHSTNYLSISINPMINYIKDFILLTKLDTTIENLPAYTFENNDIYILSLNSRVSFVFSKDLNANLELNYLKPQFEIPFCSKPQIRTNLNYKFISAYYKAIFSDKNYSILSIGLNYSIRQLEFKILLDNVFNESYIEPTNPFLTQGPYRNFSISIRLNY